MQEQYEQMNGPEMNGPEMNGPEMNGPEMNGPGMGNGQGPVKPPLTLHIPRFTIGSQKKTILISIIIAIVFALIYFYLKLPALNPHDLELYKLIGLTILVYYFAMYVFNGFRSANAKDYKKFGEKSLRIPWFILLLTAAVAVVGFVMGLPVFRADAYSKLLSIEPGDFSSEVAEINWNQIPMLDEASSNNLANRKLGELSDLVSQFTVSESSTQINYKGNPVRVNYLNYSGFFKWWNNRAKGIPAYMRTDMRTQEVEVVRLDQGIRYSPSEYLFRNLKRYLRFKYPSVIFDTITFEIDEEGTPFWIASIVHKKIGLFNGADIAGAVLVNAVTGECTSYNIDTMPSWTDRVYSADILIKQYNYYGKYLNGFFNSLFGQTDCTATTQGYNYIAQDDDVWMYTGVTSVTGDRGNIGFILINQRTKEAHYYSCAGAEEYSAMSSAEGAVQQYHYEATFPLLLNISDQPTYFMAMKDSAGLVKMYAMVNVQQYQIVATGYTLSECLQNYQKLMLQNGINTTTTHVSDPELEESVSDVITEIRSAIMDGNSIYYIRLAGSDRFYMVSAREYPTVVILNPGDSITLRYEKQDSKLINNCSLVQ